MTNYSNFRFNIKKIKNENPSEKINYEETQHLLSSNEEINISNIFLYHYMFHTVSK